MCFYFLLKNLLEICLFGLKQIQLVMNQQVLSEIPFAASCLSPKCPKHEELDMKKPFDKWIKI